MMKKIKQSPVIVTLSVLVAALAFQFGYASLALSVPQSWGDISNAVSWITGPLSDGQRDQLGTAFVATGLLLLSVALVLVYRAVREKKRSEEIEAGLSELGDLDIDGETERSVRGLLERRFGLEDPRHARPSNSYLHAALLLLTIGMALVMLAPREVEQAPPGEGATGKIALGDNKPVAGPRAGGQGAGRSGGSKGSSHGATRRGQGVLGVHTESPLSKEGAGTSSCTCSVPVSPTEEPEPTWEEPEPEWEEPEPTWEEPEPEWEEPEPAWEEPEPAWEESEWEEPEWE
ncbi:MAG TPA: hypothetical protein VFJ76_10800 [Solirubrobacterales bacterium]|nr:hypothetical protein [Solirubrobacterales bacterium]